MNQALSMAAAALPPLLKEAIRTRDGNGPHNLVVGNREDGDILLHQEQKSSAPGFGTVFHDYQYSGDTRITAVEAKDNWNDGRGGDPQIISGGVGHKSVTVRVTSRLVTGFDHTVYVYGKRKKLKCCTLI